MDIRILALLLLEVRICCIFLIRLLHHNILLIPLATIVGQYGVDYLDEKYRRLSLVSCVVIAISSVLMAVQSVFSFIDHHSQSLSVVNMD